MEKIFLFNFSSSKRPDILKDFALYLENEKKKEEERSYYSNSNYDSDYDYDEWYNNYDHNDYDYDYSYGYDIDEMYDDYYYGKSSRKKKKRRSKNKRRGKNNVYSADISLGSEDITNDDFEEKTIFYYDDLDDEPIIYTNLYDFDSFINELDCTTSINDTDRLLYNDILYCCLSKENGDEKRSLLIETSKSRLEEEYKAIDN